MWSRRLCGTGRKQIKMQEKKGNEEEGIFLSSLLWGVFFFFFFFSKLVTHSVMQPSAAYGSIHLIYSSCAGMTISHSSLGRGRVLGSMPQGHLRVKLDCLRLWWIEAASHFTLHLEPRFFFSFSTPWYVYTIFSFYKISQTKMLEHILLSLYYVCPRLDDFFFLFFLLLTLISLMQILMFAK